MDIVFEATLMAPVDRVWNAWTDAGALATWLAADAQVKIEEGGAFELFWEPEHRERNCTVGCKVIEVEPKQLLAFTWRGPAQFEDLMPAGSTYVEVSFSGSTKVTLRHRGFGASAKWAEARAWQERAWRDAFEDLAKFLA